MPTLTCYSCQRAMPTPERLYYVVAINEKSGHRENCTATPEPHETACVILDKIRACYHPAYIRIQLEGVR